MESISELRDKVAKSGISHHAPRHDVVVRKLSIYVTWLLLHTPLSANAITVLQIVVGVIGGALLIPADYVLNFAGILLLQLGYVLDCCDGEVARYRQQASVRGVFLDLIGHEIVIPFMYMGLALGEFQRGAPLSVLIFGFAVALFSLRFDIAALFQTLNTMLMKGDNPSYDFSRLERQPSRTTELATSKPSLLRVLFRYPESMNVITILLVLQWLFASSMTLNLPLIYWFLAVYGLMVPLARLYSIYAIFTSGEVEKRYREIVQAIRKQQS